MKGNLNRYNATTNRKGRGRHRHSNKYHVEQARNFYRTIFCFEATGECSSRRSFDAESSRRAVASHFNTHVWVWMDIVQDLESTSVRWRKSFCMQGQL